VGCKHEPTHHFVKDFWDHRLNRMAVRCFELCDELTRTGNLFVIVSTDSSGMSFIRPFPAADIDQIVARPNDIEQPQAFITKAGVLPETIDATTYRAYDENTDTQNEDGSFPEVMLHYTINRPVGGQWGESDLAPILKWLSRYSNWLEDRARLNRFRNAFLFIVTGKFNSEAERAARQATLAANPPAPGSILVCDQGETWSVLSSKLESSEASTDGLALKKMVASGAGIPLHFLAEPESSTKTTAEAAGGPTFRYFEQRQNYFTWIISDLLNIVINRRALVDHRVSKRAELQVRGSDISARDNVALSMAAQNVVNMLSDLRDRNLITNDEYLRMAYRFAGEIVDVEDMIAAAKREGFPVKGSDLQAAADAAQAEAARAAGQKQAGDHPAGDHPADNSAGKKNDQASGSHAINRPAGGASKIDPDTGEPKSNVDNMGG
jgi:hypothetical protein